MKATKRLRPIMLLAEHDETITARNLKASTLSLKTKLDQQERLKQYALEYREQLKSGTDELISRPKWQTIRSFMDKLTRMQDMQKRTISEAEQIIKIRKNEWQQAHNRHQILQKLYQRYKDNEQREFSKKEQAQLDEIAQQLRQIKSK